VGRYESTDRRQELNVTHETAMRLFPQDPPPGFAYGKAPQVEPFGLRSRSVPH